jgi:hypothetical protein
MMVSGLRALIMGTSVFDGWSHANHKVESEIKVGFFNITKLELQLGFP